MAKPLLRRFHADLLAGGILKGIALGSAVAAGGLLAARAFLSPLPASAFFIFAAVPLAAAVCALRALTRTPSRETCLALVEEASHAGGLLLVNGLPGSERWPHPAPVTPAVPQTWRRAIPGALTALAALAAVTAAPDSWFAAGTPPAPAPAFPDITAEIKNELADLKEAEALTPEEIEAFQEELARIEREADPAAPGETLDAVEAVREKLNTLLDIDAQATKRLLPEQASFAALAANADSAEQLRKMLKESAAGRCARCGRHLGEGEGECDGNCGGEEGEDGESGEEGDGPGRGGVSRGRGDAPLRFGEETQLGESERKDRAERAERIDTRPETQVGESIAAKDPSNNNLPITPGANRAIGGRNAGTTVQRTVLPRHRGTVKRFFDTERKQP